MTTGLLIISHDNVGKALIETAASILGLHYMALELELVSVSLVCEPENVGDLACAAISRLDKGNGVLVLTDMYGATPSNIANRLGKNTPVKVVAGMNLPMLVRVLNYPDLSLDELAYKAISGGQEGIFVCEPDACDC